MSDALHHAPTTAEPICDVAPYEPRLPATTELDLAAFVEWLPRLGSVLWLHGPRRERVFPRARMTGQGVLLLEHPDLAAFANATAIRAQSAVTPRGPREWLDIDAGASTLARLYLLPDTDYLAWDAMRDALGSHADAVEPRRWQAHRSFMQCAFARALRRWQARVIRLPLLRLPCLQILGARDAESLSPLGRRLAGAIAADEYARCVIA